MLTPALKYKYYTAYLPHYDEISVTSFSLGSRIYFDIWFKVYR
ncbi:hypothetical protein ALP13_01644 [Pseudomonas syringae pv. maculicola]|uniref:Uncharacterized protein n=1 Tax=Pseudomonas syringae pv. maculicola TaxID=59511 RepID=A0A3M6BQB7_PSEYM|nr:hypothetical protein ALP13_01644 [Pseudomonas syringae pv. maculicola]